MSADRTAHLQRLCLAIECLCRVHTRDDPETGFTVVMGAKPAPWENGVGEVDYVQAWKAMRSIIGAQVDPKSGYTAT